MEAYESQHNILIIKLKTLKKVNKHLIPLYKYQHLNLNEMTRLPFPNAQYFESHQKLNKFSLL